MAAIELETEPGRRRGTAPPSSPAPAFTAAPHRMMFFAGAVQMVLALLFWGAELIGRYTELWTPPRTSVAPAYAHLFLMEYALFPLFFLGFLMTTYPRWMDTAPIPRRHYVRSFGLLAAGLILFYFGLFTTRALLGAGVALYLAGWAAALHALLRVYATAPARDRFYERLLNGALLAGAAGIGAYGLWVASARAGLLAFARDAGLWWFLVPVVVTVAHRMIPYFSNSVLRPYSVYQPRAGLLIMLGCSLVHGSLAIAGLRQWTWPPDLVFLAVALHHTGRWGLARSLRVRLLAVLHVGFAWCSAALALYALQSLWLWGTGRSILALAPLHALGIGFLTGMTVAMASRVTLGHSGRALVADTFTWVCFWGTGLTALLRIAAALAPAFRPDGVSLNLLAAGAWLVFLGAWVARYAPMYVRPRIDGRPG